MNKPEKKICRVHKKYKNRCLTCSALRIHNKAIDEMQKYFEYLIDEEIKGYTRVGVYEWADALQELKRKVTG